MKTKIVGVVTMDNHTASENDTFSNNATSDSWHTGDSGAVDDEFEITIESPRSPRTAEDILFNIETPRDQEYSLQDDLEHHDPESNVGQGHGGDIQLTAKAQPTDSDNFITQIKDNILDTENITESSLRSDTEPKHIETVGVPVILVTITDDLDPEFSEEACLKQSKEFTDIVTTDFVSESPAERPGECDQDFTVLSDVQAETGNGDVQAEIQNINEVDDILVKDKGSDDDETVSLDNILMKDKSSDSDSEFDFELPTAKVAEPSTKQVLTDQAKLAESKVAVSQTETRSTEEKGNVFGAETVTPGAETVTPDVTKATQKPTAIIKPTSQVAEISNQVEPPVVDERKQRVLDAAVDEWDKVRTIQAGYSEAGTAKGVEPTVVETVPPMSPYELIQIFQNENFSSVRSSIRPSVERHGFSAFVNFLFGPPKLNKELHEERDQVFCIAASQLSNENSGHVRTLQTIYRCLTGSKFDCARVGSHWEEIGFQGTDPATDLRGAGMLGLLNLLYFLKDPKKQALASDVYRLSLHPTQNFPFCVMGINISRITLQSLREDILNKECNRRGEVMSVVNEFYVGLYLQLYQVWKGQGKTISDSGFVIKDIETKAKKNPRAVFKNLDEYLNKKTKIEVADRLPQSGGDDFVNVCDD